MSPTRLTSKQVHILDVIVAGNGLDGDGNLIPVDLDELLGRLGYETTKASIQFSLRALVARGLIVKGAQVERRGRSRATYYPTAAGTGALEATKAPAAGRTSVPSRYTEDLPQVGTVEGPKLGELEGFDLPAFDDLAGVNPGAEEGSES